MITLIIAWATSQLALILTGGGGVAAIAAAALGIIKPDWIKVARLVGALLIVLAAFISGYRLADDRAADAAKILRLESQVGSLSRQLDDVELVDGFASHEREQLRAGRAEALKLADDYKVKLAEKPAVQKVTVNACAIDDADLLFRGELRKRARAKR